MKLYILAMIMATAAARPGSIRRILSAESTDGASCRNACLNGNVGELVGESNLHYICNKATMKFGKSYFNCLGELENAIADPDIDVMETFCDYICPYFR
mmetsp:Transcript_27522/g.41647  ORF Transcript_27522/g.41647 Transcript_27522/m.41647 type:complete len:99 (+) Transcript_27522:111-407(+)|eukprot:CAMPEP_0178897060 /NCGR_PEP_ID=MMETSP0786-20121207/1532_1 /TAXON_ID=186022 /ORGANISM="Thalassionema frauenfeldii, Strain CCMP 1798" /LENGTH=98 /DNA_ID=CAMNT_0020567559 /DNA_START=32 /DNA_END=328 /DNA_ORIENTATION=+